MFKILIINCIIFCSFAKLLAQNTLIKGKISNYAQQPLTLYKCVGDTLIYIDSTQTDINGSFFFLSKQAKTLNFSTLQKINKNYGIYKITLQKDQFFYFLSDIREKNWGDLEIKTIYKPDFFYPIATDSLVVLISSPKKKESGSEVNKLFFEFQHIQQKINIANYFLLQMMRLYPLPDPFHKQLEVEYFSRYKEMSQFVSLFADTIHPSYQKKNGYNLAIKLALAYYQPVLPDWKQPDQWRDSIIALHFFDFFNPSDSFYLQTNILPEKMEFYLQLKTNKKDAYGQPVKDEMLDAKAAQDFLEKTKNNQENFYFCLNYWLKKFKKERLNDAFLYIYDKYGKPLLGDCVSPNTDLNWARDLASVLQGIQIGSVAPDFLIYPIWHDNSNNVIESAIKMHQLQSEYTLILFWASWCQHCTQALPKIKETINNFNSELAKKNKKIATVAVSLDTDKEKLVKYISEQGLQNFINFSEFKGWQSDVVKKYNVYATPTMFLLDSNKKILYKPETVEQLIDNLNILSTN